VSIGEDLAQARRRAGLTVTQVSQKTCIRETIIRGIEQDDYRACGGDFYARGHIRAIARVVGADPGPLIAEYDAAHHAPRPVTAADLLRPAGPVTIRERHRSHWAAVLALVLVAALGVVAYHVLAASRPAPAGHTAAGPGLHAASHRHAAAPPAPAATAPPRRPPPLRSPSTSSPSRIAGWGSPPRPAATCSSPTSLLAHRRGGPSGIR